MPLDEALHLGVIGQGPDAAGADRQAGRLQHVIYLGDGVLHGTVVDYPNLLFLLLSDDRCREEVARAVDFPAQAGDGGVVDIGVFRIHPILVMPGAPVEDGIEPAAGKGPVWNAVPVDVPVAAVVGHRIQFVLRAEYLAPVHRGVRVLESCRRPVVHAKIEVAEPEHEGLEPLSVVEDSPAVLEALVNGPGDYDNVLGVAVAGLIQHRQVALLGAGW